MTGVGKDQDGYANCYELECEGLNILDLNAPDYTINRSEEYWTGWALAYYQWETALRFSEIVRYIPIKDIIALYSPYHEMDIRHFVDKMNTLYRTAQAEYLVLLSKALCCNVEDLLEKIPVN